MHLSTYCTAPLKAMQHSVHHSLQSFVFEHIAELYVSVPQTAAYLSQLCKTSTMRWRLIEKILSLLVLAAVSNARALSFVSPKAPATGAWLNYTLDHKVNVTWTSDFENTTLRLWEGPLKNGSFIQQVLVGE